MQFAEGERKLLGGPTISKGWRSLLPEADLWIRWVAIIAQWQRQEQRQIDYWSLRQGWIWQMVDRTMYGY
jgi:hypothetical protein